MDDINTPRHIENFIDSLVKDVTVGTLYRCLERFRRNRRKYRSLDSIPVRWPILKAVPGSRVLRRSHGGRRASVGSIVRLGRRRLIEPKPKPKRGPAAVSGEEAPPEEPRSRPPRLGHLRRPRRRVPARRPLGRPKRPPLARPPPRPAALGEESSRPAKPPPTPPIDSEPTVRLARDRGGSPAGPAFVLRPRRTRDDQKRGRRDPGREATTTR